ncbi:hypothetical protein C2G38_2215893 [Gigaspora rosea]|uniref:C2H2-type domain-containing protein n=1 Tax=Gigaspora rosea TaxID=44941 RepID=A0A397U9S2_9GLOM|nr:hypothetical protein C2G38_2215893 [Gigaspora rosea]
MRWQCEYCDRQFTKSNALAQHISKSHLYLQNTNNQSVSDEQSDDNIWKLPDYSLHYDSSSEYDSNNSFIIDVTEVIPASPMPGFDPLWETESDFNENEEISASPHSDMEADYSSTDSELLSVEDEQPQTESIEIDPDDYDEFMEIVNRYQFSNSANDAVIKFFNKYSNLDISPLPSTTKSGKEFLDNLTIPHMMFKEDDLNNISLTGVSPRTPNNMKWAIENGEAQDYSIHPEPNAFWGIR